MLRLMPKFRRLVIRPIGLFPEKIGALANALFQTLPSFRQYAE